MILPLFRKKRPDEPIFAVYTAIVAQSRQEIFYARWGVPDTITGRFDMISLHMALVFRRLRSGGEEAKEFSQQLFDRFFLDMDRSLREMGVGDLSVGKRIEKMGGLFYGLLSSLNAAFESPDRKSALADMIERNMVEEGHGGTLEYFVAYVEGIESRLQTQSHADIMAGMLDLEVK